MKTEEYIKSLIAERDELKSLCESHVETIRLLKSEVVKLNRTITKKDKIISIFENDNITNASDVDFQIEFENIQSEMEILKKSHCDLLQEYDKFQNEYTNLHRKNVDLQRKNNTLKNKCEELQKENVEYKSIIDECNNEEK